MGYTTDFYGSFKLNKPLDLATFNLLKKLAETDHRNDSSKPGYYCQWVTNEEGTEIEWDGGEKFYNYTEWLQYIIKILAPKGFTLNGEVKWSGEDDGDQGILCVTNNLLTIKRAKVTFE